MSKGNEHEGSLDPVNRISTTYERRGRTLALMTEYALRERGIVFPSDVQYLAVGAGVRPRAEFGLASGFKVAPDQVTLLDMYYSGDEIFYIRDSYPDATIISANIFDYLRNPNPSSKFDLVSFFGMAETFDNTGSLQAIVANLPKFLKPRAVVVVEPAGYFDGTQSWQQQEFESLITYPPGNIVPPGAYHMLYTPGEEEAGNGTHVTPI